MLGKLIKYDFKSCGRILLPLFALSVALSAVLRLALVIAPYIWEPVQRLLEGSATFLGALLLFVITILTFVALVVRFYQSLISGEGYLSFTLPVSATSHLLSRLIVSCCFMLASLVVTLISMAIFIPGFVSGFAELLTQPMTFYENGEAVNYTLGGMPFYLWLSAIGLVLFVALVGAITNFLHIYASFAIGSQFGRHRILSSVVAYFVLNFAESLILTPLMLVPMNYIFGENMNEINAFFQSLYIGTGYQIIGNMLGVAWLVFAVISIPSLIFAVVHFFLSRYFFTKKINLE